MRLKAPRILFDEQDDELVEVVNEFLTSGFDRKPEQLLKLFDPSLHPRGVKELAASRQRRIAFAVIRLLDSLEMGDARERLAALRALHNEILYGGRASMVRNTARVLLAIMKQLVRERDDHQRQVELAHDFFAAVSGRPGVIRRELRKHHLLEMSESWNQVAFDHHVHDANTKGRKAPTHLIMDAWIKGIRELTVIYYNYMTGEALAELVEAAEIMEIKVRACVEVAAVFRGKFVQFIWEPHGFEGPADFLAFLDEPPVRAFFDEGREVAKLHKSYVLALVQCFNERHLADLNEAYELDVEPIAEQEFLGYVGTGQPSVAHLADFVHHKCLDRMQALLPELRERYSTADETERKRLERQVQQLNELSSEVVADEYLAWSKNPELPNPNAPNDSEGVPPMLKRSPAELIARLDALRPGARITLNPSNLSGADVLEVLYDTKGAVTHLEIFNLKDYKRKRNPYINRIGLIRRTLNGGSPIALKGVIQKIIADVEEDDEPDREDRLEKLREIRADMLGLLDHYSRSPLRSRIGSDSTGRSRGTFGMGLAVMDTLVPRAQREMATHAGTREVIPVKTEALLTTTWLPRESPITAFDWLYRTARSLPGVKALGYHREDSYVVPPNVTRICKDGNIVTLGGFDEHPSNGLSLNVTQRRPTLRWRHLNVPFKKALKVLIGFIPAFLTFFFTKDWWVLAFLGAPIWFAITGVRNVVQATVGGGGIFRSHLLRWKDLVSWERIADSLFFTGFSVPLLDWLVKGLLLDRGLNINTQTSPLLLYSVMALANGLYLFSHNTFRGLPRAAAIGNLFRSILSIPLAFGANAGIFELLRLAGMSPYEANAMLQLWAAVIGKAASDTVAGFIEGAADRNANMRVRNADYRAKLSMLLDVHGRLEALFPHQDVIELLKSPRAFFQRVREEGDDETKSDPPLTSFPIIPGQKEEVRELRRRQIINALDLMYFWMYQPRARVVFRRRLATATPEERQIILATQLLLERQRAISKMFLDGLVGKNFPPPLAFYLDKSPSYLRDMDRLSKANGWGEPTRDETDCKP